MHKLLLFVLFALLGSGCSDAVERYRQHAIAKELTELKELAEEGDASAQNSLGLEYLYATDEADRDVDAAILWYEKSANQGYLDSQTALSTIYLPVFGERPDAEKAFYWSKKAAEQGHAYSQLLVYYAYQYAEGVTKDTSTALTWLSKSASAGDPEAQNILSGKYFDGDGVVKDSDKALYWLEQAARQGHLDAEVDLVRRLYNGDGVITDYAKAFKLAQSYVNDNGVSYDSFLYYTLGEMYEYGHGIRQDLDKAKESYGLSCDESYQDGCDKFKQLNERTY